MNRLKLLTGIGLLLLSIISGCTQESAPGSDSLPEEAPTSGAEEQPVTAEPADDTLDSTPAVVATPERPTRELPSGLQTVPPSVEPGVKGEVPETLLNQIIADLASRLSMDAAGIEIISDESVVWNDGSLGCAQPGQFYTQALVDGYHVILKVGEQTYDYRAAQSGYFFLCERPSPGGNPVSPGTPTS